MYRCTSCTRNTSQCMNSSGTTLYLNNQRRRWQHKFGNLRLQFILMCSVPCAVASLQRRRRVARLRLDARNILGQPLHDLLWCIRKHQFGLDPSTLITAARITFLTSSAQLLAPWRPGRHSPQRRYRKPNLNQGPISRHLSFSHKSTVDRCNQSRPTFDLKGAHRLLPAALCQFLHVTFPTAYAY
jgi:hypothetical protein